ncbi:MAG: hypothetical protein ACPHXR_07860 [Flavicella sp.]
MKKNIFLILIILSNCFCNAQNTFKLVRKQTFEKDVFLGYDTHKNLFAITNNQLLKITADKEIAYANYSFGKIHAVDISNPLKIIIFYKDFNNIVIVDNQLNEREIIQVDYDIDFSSNGISDNIWLITSNFKRIQNYNFKTKKVISNSPPITLKNIKNVKSNANNIYLQNKDGIYTYDYLGNLLDSLRFNKINDFQRFKNTFYISTQNEIYKVAADKSILLILSHSNIVNFEIINGDFYIFDGKELSQYSTKTNK